MGFDEDSPQYKTCGCCHVRRSIVLMAIVEIAIEIAAIIVNFIPLPLNIELPRWNQSAEEYSDDGTYSTTRLCWDILVPVQALLIIASAILAILGMKKLKAAYLLPHIVLQVISLLGIVLLLVIFGLGIAASFLTGDDTLYLRPSTGLVYFCVVVECVLALGFMLGVWFLVAFIRGYRYIKHKLSSMRTFGKFHAARTTVAAASAPPSDMKELYNAPPPYMKHHGSFD